MQKHDTQYGRRPSTSARDITEGDVIVRRSVRRGYERVLHERVMWVRPNEAGEVFIRTDRCDRTVSCDRDFETLRDAR